ncbi:MAG: hypothetical protein U0941_29975 [Planctomycetaceae bacterium]
MNRRKRITFAVDAADYVALRDCAIKRGLELGPMIEGILKPVAEAIRATPPNRDESPA